jgi:hypothetical protein
MFGDKSNRSYTSISKIHRIIEDLKLNRLKDQKKD